jgi:hypothetical protein
VSALIHLVEESIIDVINFQSYIKDEVSES